MLALGTSRRNVLVWGAVLLGSCLMSSASTVAASSHKWPRLSEAKIFQIRHLPAKSIEEVRSSQQKKSDAGKRMNKDLDNRALTLIKTLSEKDILRPSVNFVSNGGPLVKEKTSQKKKKTETLEAAEAIYVTPVEASSSSSAFDFLSPSTSPSFDSSSTTERPLSTPSAKPTTITTTQIPKKTTIQLPFFSPWSPQKSSQPMGWLQQQQFFPLPFLFFPSILQASGGLFQSQPASDQSGGLTPASTTRLIVPPAANYPWAGMIHPQHAFRPPIHPVGNYFYIP